MNFLKSLLVFLYFCIYLAIGLALIVIGLDILPMGKISEILSVAYANQNIRYAIAGIGCLFILIGAVSARISISNTNREKTIAFDNPDGQVMVSLDAIEDYMRKVVKQISQVKEIKPAVKAHRNKVLIVEARAVIYSDTNIPEVTEKVQALLKSKLLEMLPLEETINIKIYVTKLATQEKDVKSAQSETSRQFPFTGLL